MDEIDKTAARLRASKARADDDLRAEGRKVGQQWARDDATFPALRAVVGFDWDAQYPLMTMVTTSPA